MRLERAAEKRQKGIGGVACPYLSGNSPFCCNQQSSLKNIGIRRRARHGARAIEHPLRKLRLALRWVATREGPMFDPSGAVFARIIIRHAVSRIAERLIQGD